jgi:cysteine desulfurase
MDEVIYLDNNATTRPCAEAVAAILPFLNEAYGNPSSVHRFGQRARQAVDEARGKVAGLIGCQESELLFTGGGTESISTAIRGILAVRSPRKRIVTSTVEHSATRELCQALMREGYEVVEVPVDHQGHLDEQALEAALSPETALVSLLLANNETGMIWPGARLAAVCRGKGVPLHLDATQAVGKLPLSVREIGADAMSFASHKFHGPKGVGGLYVRRGLRFRPLLIGGPQERGRRGGTENVPGIVGMGAAAEQARLQLPEMARVSTMRDRLEAEIRQRCPEVVTIGDPGCRLANTANIAFPGLEAEAILLLLSEQGVCASAGAACASGSLEPSHVLQAMQVPMKVAHGAVRFSLSRYTTDAEIDSAVRIVPAVVERLYRVLPVA